MIGPSDSLPRMRETLGTVKLVEYRPMPPTFASSGEIALHGLMAMLEKLCDVMAVWT